MWRARCCGVLTSCAAPCRSCGAARTRCLASLVSLRTCTCSLFRVPYNCPYNVICTSTSTLTPIELPRTTYKRERDRITQLSRRAQITEISALGALEERLRAGACCAPADEPLTDEPFHRAHCCVLSRVEKHAPSSPSPSVSSSSFCNSGDETPGVQKYE